MATSPLPFLAWVELQFSKLTDEGYVPNSGGFVETLLAGTSTPKVTYTQNTTASPANPTIIQLDANGRPPDDIFLFGAYTVNVYDSDNDPNLPGAVPLYSRVYVADVGALYAENYGAAQAAGTKGITSSPYVVLATDRTITVDSTTNPFIVTLPDVTTWTTPLYVINESDSVTGGTVRLTPAAGQTVQQGIGGSYFPLSPATSLAKWALLLPDSSSSNWLCFSNQT